MSILSKLQVHMMTLLYSIETSLASYILTFTVVSNVYPIETVGKLTKRNKNATKQQNVHISYLSHYNYQCTYSIMYVIILINYQCTYSFIYIIILIILICSIGCHCVHPHPFCTIPCLYNSEQPPLSPIPSNNLKLIPFITSDHLFSTGVLGND
jgi:hypothetical protein